MRKLNLGCGARYRPGWTNVDVAPRSAAVQRVDLTRRLPFKGDSFEVVYLSHVLEHLPLEGAERLLLEIERVLAPRGLVRVVVPDLERACRAYLKSLESPSVSAPLHRWRIVEIGDQAWREESGGLMARLLAELSREDFEALAPELGSELTELREALLSRAPPRRSLRGALCGLLLRRLPALRAYAVGRFRLSGECHKHMYDHRELSWLLERCRFDEVARRDFETSAYPGDWAEERLDHEDGAEYKPGSLYMEGHKPERSSGEAP